MSLRVSLSDVARRVGCTKSTVSIALRGDKRVTPKTREKIRLAAEQMGYRPNPALASLASYRFHPQRRIQGIPIAFLTQDGNYSSIEDGIYTIERSHAAEMGYDLQHYHLPELQKLRDPARMLYQRGIDGIILSDFFRINSLPNMNWNLFAVVALGGDDDESGQLGLPSFHRVGIDHFGAVRRCWRQALKAGYERIGLALYTHNPPISDDIVRQAAGLYCLERMPFQHRIPIFHDHFQENSLVIQALANWMRSYRPDVVIGFNRHVAWALQESGWNIPEQVAFIDLLWVLRKTQFAGMEDMGSKAIKAAVELIDQQIRHRQRGIPEEPRVVTIQSRWISGLTLPIKARAS